MPHVAVAPACTPMVPSRFPCRRRSGAPTGDARCSTSGSRTSDSVKKSHRRWRLIPSASGSSTSSPTERKIFNDAEDRVIRLATTLNAYEHVAFTSRSTNMGTYVYEQLSQIPEQYRGLLIDELTDRGLTNCWFIAGLLYKIKLVERETQGPLDISNDLEAYQERMEVLQEMMQEEGYVASVERDLESSDDDAYEIDDGVVISKSERKRVALAAATSGVQVFEGRAANIPGGPFINRFQKVFYPAPLDKTGGTWHGRVVLKKPKLIEQYLPLYFKTNDTLERFLKVPATQEDCDLLLDYTNPPYLESDMPVAMEYPSRTTAGVSKAFVCPSGDPINTKTWWPIPKFPIPPFDTLVDYLRPLGPGVYVGKGWRGEGAGDEFLTFILFRRVDVREGDLEED